MERAEKRKDTGLKKASSVSSSTHLHDLLLSLIMFIQATSIHSFISCSSTRPLNNKAVQYYIMQYYWYYTIINILPNEVYKVFMFECYGKKNPALK